LYSHFWSARFETDSGKFFALVCTLTTGIQTDTGVMKISYYAKRPIDSAWFWVNKGPLYSKPVTDTVFLEFKQAGLLTVGTSFAGMSMRFAGGSPTIYSGIGNKCPFAAGAKATLLVQSSVVYSGSSGPAPWFASCRSSSGKS
jgi:hypothetical protein